MSRYAAFVLCFSFGLVFHLSHGTEVNVTDGEKSLCLYANLMLNFSVSYDVVGNKSQTVVIELPDAVKSDGSKCGANSSTLKLDFGEGHSWSVSFSSSGKSYQADVVTFSYNLSDTSFFPDSLSNETLTVTSKADFSVVSLDTCYSCNSKDQIKADRVNMTLWNVLIQAFIVNGSRSDNKTICPADTPTTAAPTTTVPTTPVTNATTAAPITNATTVAPTTPTPTLPPPSTGNYTVKLHSDQNTTCLLANFGLRIGFKIKEKYQEMNFDPVGAGVSGSCDLDSSELVLERDQMNVTFTFKNDTKKFFLHALNVSLTTSSGAFIGSSTNLSLWEASIGSSYMCNKEQNFTISDQLSLFTFSLHVQPFGVKKGVFSTAHECSLDDPSILIPIIVGAALAGLILIVVVAYVIGRRKTYAGYQTL